MVISPRVYKKDHIAIRYIIRSKIMLINYANVK